MNELEAKCGLVRTTNNTESDSTRGQVAANANGCAEEDGKEALWREGHVGEA